MDINELIRQCRADSRVWFPLTSQSLVHQVLSLCGETGELANIVKKIDRGTLTAEVARHDMALEVVDILVYVCNLMGLREFNDVDWVEVWNQKRAWNEARFAPRKVNVVYLPRQES